jgi:hypothetical protein
LLRPFCEQAQVKSHGYSRRLQRVLVDFGAESSFHKSVERIQEHYGISVPVASVRQHTLKHGRAMTSIPSAGDAKAAAQLITQMDGSMIPVMQKGATGDGRKAKRCFGARSSSAAPGLKDKHALCMPQPWEAQRQQLGFGKRSPKPPD